MRILEIEQYFKEIETLPKVLESLTDDLNRVDEYAEMVKTNAYGNAEKIKEIMKQLSGCYSNVRTVFAIAKAMKKNIEARKYNSLKAEISNAGEKFVSAAVDREASAYVAEYRRVRDILEGYKESIEKDISVLQSILKDENKEYNHPQQGE